MLVTIYVYLLDEGVDVWRPVRAEQLPDELYRILGTVPEDERWEFALGEIVRCRKQTLLEGTSPGECLVAYERVAY